MSRHLRPAALLLAAAALTAGCGSSSISGPAAPEAKRGAAPGASGTQLRVAAVGAGVGRATTATPDGIQLLPGTRVPDAPGAGHGIGAGANCDDADVMPAAGNLGTVEAATRCLINAERADAGLRPLKPDGRLEKAAMRHSREMVEHQFFSHVGRNGSDPVDRIRSVGYIPGSGSWTVGENLAWGTGSLATPKAIVAAWMRSQGHRENILRRSYKEIGFGIVAGNPRSGSGSGATYTTTFGAVSKPARRSRRGSRAKRSRKNRRKLMVARISVPRGR